MRIVVCVKQVYDPKTVKVSRSREEFDLREAVKILNPADKYALEAALTLREAQQRETLGGEVIALTIGDAGAEDVVHEAVAFGADRGILVVADGPFSGKMVTALAAAAVTRLGGIDLVLTGQIGAIDGTGSLAPRLAGALGWPVVLDTVRFNVEAAGLSAVVAHGADAGLAPISLPAVISIAPGASRPRYPHPARIAIAWEPGWVETWGTETLNLSEGALAPDTEPAGLVLGPERIRGQVIKGSVQEAARELAGLLKTRRLI